MPGISRYVLSVLVPGNILHYNIISIFIGFRHGWFFWSRKTRQVYL